MSFDTPSPISFHFSFQPIALVRKARLASESDGARHFRTEKNSTPFVQKFHIIEEYHYVLSEINACRNELKKPIPLYKLKKKCEAILSHIHTLSASMEEIDDNIRDLKRLREYQMIDVDFLHQEVLHSLIPPTHSLCNALTDPLNCKRHREITTKLSTMKSEGSILSCALQSLNQYQKILRAYEEALSDGITMEDPIEIPKHLHTINDRIYFLGEKFSLLKEIGEGSWAKVQQCKLGDQLYAVKISKASLTCFRNLNNPDVIFSYDNLYRRDVYIPLLLNHPNIIKLYGIHNDKAILQYIPTGTLALWLERGHFSEQQIVEILLDIANALEHMHNKEIIHRDLKPQNILIDDSNHQIKAILIDFGTAQSASKRKSLTLAGTAQYMPPEVLQILATNQKRVRRDYILDHLEKSADIWGFGQILYQLLSGGRELYSERRIGISSKTKFNFKQTSGIPTITYKPQDQFSLSYLQNTYKISAKKSPKSVKNEQLVTDLLTLCSLCLQKQAQKRPDIAEVIEHLHTAKKLL